MFGDVAPQANVFGRLAIASLKTKVSASYAGNSASESDSNVGVILGLGAGYALTKNLSIDANLDFGKHKYSDGSSNVTMFGIGVTASF
jgi:opacity protein-like surface antigen